MKIKKWTQISTLKYWLLFPKIFIENVFFQKNVSSENYLMSSEIKCHGNEKRAEKNWRRNFEERWINSKISELKKSNANLHDQK